MVLKIGLLGLQGAIEEHEVAVMNAGRTLGLEVQVSRVTLPEQLEGLDGIILPGGESTAMIKQGTRSGLLPRLNSMLAQNFPAFGTCAGAILLSKKVRRTEDSPVTQGAFPFLDIEILRNGYGSQRDSFSTDLMIKGFEEPFEGVFIRAPIISEPGTSEVLASTRGYPVFVRSGKIMVTTFHPELTEDTRIHSLFLKSIIE